MKTKLELVYTLQSPISHIGESSSTVSFLNDLSIVTENGIEQIFIYSANASRGLWRDLGAKYLLDKLGTKLPLKEFHVLFSGGNISGAQSADIDQARKIREKLPFVSVFGGGVENQILEGCLKIGFGYPVCRETYGVINNRNPYINPVLLEKQCGELTSDISFTRVDDSKGDIGKKYLEDSTEAGKKEKGQATTQMRYEVEYLIPGTQLYQEVYFDGNDEELGAFYRSLVEFAASPFIGGMGGKGFGKVDVVVTEKGEKVLEIANDEVKTSEKVKELLDVYDATIDKLIMSGETIEEILRVTKK